MNVMQSLLNKYRKKKNKVIRGGEVLPILFFLIISLLIPPIDIYAETINSHVIGVNVWSERLNDNSYTINNTQYWENYVDVHIQFELDDDYIGWTNLGIVVNYYNYYYGAQDPSWGQASSSWSGSYYINGSSFEIIIPIKFYSSSSAYYQNGNSLPNSSSSLTISYSNQGNVVASSELTTLQDILSVMNDIYTSVDDLENKQQLMYDILNRINNRRHWNVPIESMPYCTDLLSMYSASDFYTNNYFNYPLIKIENGQSLIRTGQSASTFYVVVGFNRWITSSNISTLTTTNYNIDSVELLIPGYYNIYKIVFKSPSNGTRFTWTWNDSNNVYVIPIFFNVNTRHLSTDFAITYGFSNELLDNINVIAQGTTQSNQASSDLNNQTSSFENTSNNLYTSENAFNTDMNNKLQSIDTSFNPSTSFGSKFLSAADWVRTQYGNLTNTTPFGSVLSFSMLLGLSLLIIGKVFK